MDKRKAIILFNLGGPDKIENVRPFLYNLFSDKQIIRVPFLVRQFIAFVISTIRYKTAQENYKIMGGKSPLFEETVAQKIALEQSLKDHNFCDFRIFISMRYWHPSSDVVIKDLKKYNPDEIIFLPLYPQFSSSTTQSSFEDFERRLQEENFKAGVRKIGCYFDQEDFIKSHIVKIKEKIKKFTKGKKFRILFSAHSIPKKFVVQGDPYEWQINKTVEAIIKDKEINKHEYVLCYQSKVGPVEWLGPSTEHEVEKSAKEGVNIIITPIAFVSEHIETLVELDVEYKAIADKYAVQYERVDALSTNVHFINSLTKMICSVDESGTKNFSSEKCPREFNNCICKG